MIEDELKQETEKWLNKILEKRGEIELIDKSKKDLIKNIDAYISDSKHFLEKNELVKAFEAVLWSWAWVTILDELGIIKIK